MKSLLTLSLCCTAPCLLTTAFANEAPDTEPSIPVGKLTISATVVKPDVIPNLSWEITHPQSLRDIVDIDKDNDVPTVGDDKVVVKISMIGTGITSNGGRTQHESVSEIKFGNGAWEHVFTGKGDAVDPSEVLIERELDPNTPIYFRSRYIGYRSWRYNDSREVQILINGDNPPSNPSSGGAAISAEEYMKPYTKNGKLVLGPLDMIYAAELTHTDTYHSGYDMQDSIVLVTFSEVTTQLGSTKGEVAENINGGESNNGHEDESPNYYENDDDTHNGGSNKNNKLTRWNDWSGYMGWYGSGYQGGGYRKNYNRRRRP